MARVSGGRRFDNGVDLAVSGTVERSDGDARLCFPAFDAAATHHGVAVRLDGERAVGPFGRLTVGTFAIVGAIGDRAKTVPTASFGTIFNEQAESERWSAWSWWATRPRPPRPVSQQTGPALSSACCLAPCWSSSRMRDEVSVVSARAPAVIASKLTGNRAGQARSRVRCAGW